MEVPSESTEVSPRDALLLKLGLGADARAEDLERAFRKRLGEYEAQVQHAGSKPERIAAKGTLKSFEQLLPQVRAEAARLRIDVLLEECREGIEKKRVGAVTRKLASIRTLCDENNLDDGALTREIDDIEGDLEDVRLILGIPAGAGADAPAEDTPAEKPETPEVPRADLPAEDADEPEAASVADPPEAPEPVATTDTAQASEASKPEEPVADAAAPETGEAPPEATEEPKVVQPPPLPPDQPQAEPPPEEPAPAEVAEETSPESEAEPTPEPEAEPPEPSVVEPPPVIAEYAQQQAPAATAAGVPADASFAPMAAQCFSLAGPEEERVHILSKEQLVFGRSRDCDIVVRAYAQDEETARQLSRKISRAHFTIERRPDDVQISDGSVVEGRRKRSGNGTYADGQPVDTIQIFRTGVEQLKLTREGEAQAPPSWTLELTMECPLGASTHPALAQLPTGPQALLLKRMDGLCEDLLLLWGCVNLRTLGLAEEDLWLARLAGGFGLWDGSALVPMEPGFRVGAAWTAAGFDALDYAKLVS